MSRTTAPCLAALFLCIAATGAHAACFDLRQNEPRMLSGMLGYGTFPGPPDYEDIGKGDAAEGAYILKLPKPICLTGDEDFADPSLTFDEVHLVPEDETADAMEAARDITVEVQLSRQMPAMTGHHRRPLVAWVKAIRQVPDSLTNSATTDLGDAAAVVRAFYDALAQGDGSRAARYVIPEKSGTGPLSAKAMTGFYGRLRQPLALVSLMPAGTNRFSAHYSFVSNSGRCDGSALVNVVRRGKTYMIETIRAQNGC